MNWREICLGSDLRDQILSYGEGAKIGKSNQVKLLKYIQQVP